MNMDTGQRLPVTLLTLRLGVFLVMVMWTLDKLIQPKHTAGVFANVYGHCALGPTISMIIGAAQLVLAAYFALYLLRDQNKGHQPMAPNRTTVSQLPHQCRRA